MGAGLNEENLRFCSELTPIFTPRRAVHFQIECKITLAAIGTNPQTTSWAVSLKGVGGKADEML